MKVAMVVFMIMMIEQVLISDLLTTEEQLVLKFNDTFVFNESNFRDFFFFFKEMAICVWANDDHLFTFQAMLIT